MKNLRAFLAAMALAVLAALSPLAPAVAADGKGETSCEGGGCNWSANTAWSDRPGGNWNGSGQIQSAQDGSLSLPEGNRRFDFADGAYLSLDGLWGNIDPIIGFSFAAGTGAEGRTFSITYSIPVALSGLIEARSSVSYSLTSTTSAGAQIQPLLGHVVIAQEVDTSIGGLLPLNKGVDVGGTFFFTGGPQTQNSPVYTASNTFVGSFAYDLMSVTLAFSLSPYSYVGISGFVEQVTAVPEPSTLLLLAAGLALVALMGRRGRRDGLAHLAP